jgi:hypothetical protein
MWCEEDFGGSSVVLCQADSFEEVLVVVERLLDRLFKFSVFWLAKRRCK